MPKRSTERLQRVHIQVFEEDWAKLLTHYGGVAKRSGVIRNLVRTWVKRIEERAERKTSGAGGIVVQEEDGMNE